jgi:aminoglycoside phosphotransferase (APT) family kinase protein
MKELSEDRFVVPELLEWNRTSGVTVWSELRGNSLYRFLTRPDKNRNGAGSVTAKTAEPLDGELLVAASRAAGKALRELHNTPLPDNLPRHRPSDEISVLRKWLSNLRIVRPEYISHCLAHFDKITTGLKTDHSRYVLLHRDFYDKQVIVSGDGNVGLLDLDTIAIGDAALDLANALVHMELRVLQRRCSLERATKAARALIEGYDPGREVHNRLSVYSDASRLRLACVYSYRPKFSNIVPSLLARIRQPTIGLDIGLN